jgi:hypothetical protein
VAEPDDVGEVPPSQGWQAVRGHRLSLLLPQLAMRRARSIDDRELGARVVYASFVVMHVGLGAIVALSLAGAEGARATNVGLGLVAVVVVGLGAVFSRFRTSTRRLDCTDARNLADSWYARFLRECTMATLILPWAVLAGLATASLLVYVVGLVIAVVNLFVMAPTDARIARDSAASVLSGCDVVLPAALRSGGRLGGPPRRGGGGRGGGGGGGARRGGGGSSRTGGTSKRTGGPSRRTGGGARGRKRRR